MSKLSTIAPQERDIVRVKFKSINDIVTQHKDVFDDADDTYEIGSNFKAYNRGGDFIVVDGYVKDEEGDEYIVVKNHLDCQHTFYIYKEVIDTIEIVEDAELFVSTDHRLLVVRVGDELYVNGKPLIWDEERQREHHISMGETGEFKNPNRKLLKIFENYIADLAVRESFNSHEGKL